MRHRKLERAIAMFGSFLYGCTGVVEPPLPVGAVPMEAAPQFALWWRLTERCAGRTGDLASISWYVVPGADNLGSSDIQGEYTSGKRRIVLAGHWADDPLLVRHEMLHAIINRSGHPAEYFQQRCGGVVVCEADCVNDGGGLPPRDASGPVVRPRDLDISARVDSTRPSLARDSAWIALTVEIHNARSTPVRVRLTPLRPDFIASATYGFRTVNCALTQPPDGPAYFFVYDTTMVLAAGESQRGVWDFHVRNSCELVRPFFNDDTLDAIRVELQP